MQTPNKADECLPPSRTTLSHHAILSGVHATLRNHSKQQFMASCLILVFGGVRASCLVCVRQIAIRSLPSRNVVTSFLLEIQTATGNLPGTHRPSQCTSLEAQPASSRTARTARLSKQLPAEGPRISAPLASSKSASELRSCDAVLSNRKRTRQRTKTDEDKGRRTRTNCDERRRTTTDL